MIRLKYNLQKYVGIIICSCIIFVAFRFFGSSNSNVSNDNSYDTPELPTMVDFVNIVTRIENIEQKIDNFILDYKHNMSAKAPKPQKAILPNLLKQESTLHVSPAVPAKNKPKKEPINVEVLQPEKCERNFTLLIILTSHISHFDQRNLVRNTWARRLAHDKTNWKVYFLIGKSENVQEMTRAKNELADKRDIILASVYENFENVIYKVQASFKWSLAFCNYRFLFKGDDDIFINIPLLINLLSESKLPKQLYMGEVKFEELVPRSGKYAVSQNVYKKKYFPRFCSGGGSVLSRDAVSELIHWFHEVPYLPADDPYIGLLVLKAGIDVHHINDFVMFQEYLQCNFKKTSVVHHPVTDQECMEYLFQKILLDLVILHKL